MNTKKNQSGQIRVGGGFIALLLLIIVLLVTGNFGWAIALAVVLAAAQFIG